MVTQSQLLSAADKRRKILNPKTRSEFTKKLQEHLSSKIMGQDEALDSILDSMSRVITGIRNKEKPILTMLFLGPTGTGKTEVVKELSNFIFGDRNSFIRVNCQELSESHTVAKLLGSPPGYVGSEIEPMLSEDNIIKPCEQAWVHSKGIYANVNVLSKKYDPSECNFISLILFDEIEKAHPKIWTSLLGMMDDGHLTIGNNETVNFTNSIIIMTTNIGSRELDNSLSNRGIGFQIDTDVDQKQIDSQAKEQVEKHFPPEFVNRFNKIVSFNPLSTKNISKILDIQVDNFYKTLVEANMPLKINLSKTVKDKIIEMGSNSQYGARHLNRKLEELIFTPISRMVASGQLISDDVVNVTLKSNEICFTREPRTEIQMEKWIKSTTVKKARTKRVIRKKPVRNPRKKSK